jgi:hypothetical protein
MLRERVDALESPFDLIIKRFIMSQARLEKLESASNLTVKRLIMSRTRRRHWNYLLSLP